MPREKEKVYLNKFEEKLKNPPHNKYVLVYTESEDEDKPVKDTKDRITLKQVVDMMNDKFQKLDAKMDAGFNQVNSRIDNLEKRIDNIEVRLDYNGLQIEQINKRLDYNGLQIEQINKRLDYNGLKKLPENK